jgi:hypothetical protein
MADEQPGPTWSEWLRHDVEYAKTTIMKHGMLQGLFAIHGRDGRVFLVQSNYADTDEKHDTYDMLRVMCIAYDAIALSHMCEAWIRMLSPRDKETRAEMMERARTGPKPSQAEDRKEIIAVTLAYREDEQRHVIGETYEIIRDFTTGKITGLEPMDFPDENTSMGGDVPELLPATTPNPTQRAVAAAFVKKVVGTMEMGTRQ